MYSGILKIVLLRLSSWEKLFLKQQFLVMDDMIKYRQITLKEWYFSDMEYYEKFTFILLIFSILNQILEKAT